MLPMVTGDFLTCWGDERGPRGEKTAWVTEKGVEAAGVGAAPWCCEGVLPCCESGSLPGVGVDMVTALGDYCVMCMYFRDGEDSWEGYVKAPTSKPAAEVLRVRAINKQELGVSC